MIGRRAGLVLAGFGFIFSAGIAAGAGSSGESDAARPPDWVRGAKHSASDIYVVGVATGAASYEEALEKAWINGLGIMAKTQFPFLMNIREYSRESLTGADYRRDTDVSLAGIQWEGLEEDTRAGSPWLETRDSRGGREDGTTTFAAWRLLKWSRVAVAAERKRLQSRPENAPEQLVYSSVVGKKGVATGVLRVVSDPPGAALLLDGEFIGRTNADFRAVGAGTYQLAVSLAGHDLVTQEVVVHGAGIAEVRVKLEKSRGTVSINSTPSGAVVYVDHLPDGRKTPFDVELEEGSHSIRVEAPGHYPESRSVVVEARRKNELAIDLTPKPGRLSVLTRPVGAKVYIDGEAVGKSDLLNQLVKGGDRKVRVEKDGFSTVEDTVYVNELKGQSLVINLMEEVKSQPVLSGNDYYLPGRGNVVSASGASPMSREEIAQVWMWGGVAAMVIGMMEISSAGTPPEEEYECDAEYRKCGYVKKDNGYDQGKFDRGSFLLFGGSLMAVIGIVQIGPGR